MRIKNWLGGLGAAALVLGLCSLSSADEKQLKIKVSTNEELFPPSCSISCSPGNLRSSGAHMTTTWHTNGNSVTLEANTPGGSESHPGPYAANGSHGHQYAYAWGYYWYTARCRRSNGLESTSSCYSLLSCFPAGTKVLLCDGTEKAIEQIPAGTSVMAWDPDSQTFKCSTVQQQIKTETDKRYKITTSAGGKELEITPTHRLLVNGAWKDSSEVKEGDLLLYADGTSVKVEKIELIEEQVDVYNLITDFPNDFFAENILVHNENAKDQKDKGFLSRTRVMKADGTQVTIDQIKAGDKIMAWDPKTGRYMPNLVKQVTSGKLTKTVQINGKLRMGTAHVLFRPQAPKKGK